MWALGYDKHYPELWNVLRDKFFYIPLDTSDGTGKPEKFKLYQNYPNPFNPSTTIKYDIPLNPPSKGDSGAGGCVTLKIYDILGNEVATLVDEIQAPGKYEVKFNVGTDSKSVLPNGVYFYQLSVGDNVETKKMLLIK